MDVHGPAHTMTIDSISVRQGEAPVPIGIALDRLIRAGPEGAVFQEDPGKLGEEVGPCGQPARVTDAVLVHVRACASLNRTSL